MLALIVRSFKRAVLRTSPIDWILLLTPMHRADDSLRRKWELIKWANLGFKSKQLAQVWTTKTTMIGQSKARMAKNRCQDWPSKSQQTTMTTWLASQSKALWLLYVTEKVVQRLTSLQEEHLEAINLQSITEIIRKRLEAKALLTMLIWRPRKTQLQLVQPIRASQRSMTSSSTCLTLLASIEIRRWVLWRVRTSSTALTSSSPTKCRARRWTMRGSFTFASGAIRHCSQVKTSWNTTRSCRARARLVEWIKPSRRAIAFTWSSESGCLALDQSQALIEATLSATARSARESLANTLYKVFVATADTMSSLLFKSRRTRSKWSMVRPPWRLILAQVEIQWAIWSRVLATSASILQLELRTAQLYHMAPLKCKEWARDESIKDQKAVTSELLTT